MDKIIIDNRTDLLPAEALEYITSIVRTGRISDGGRQYCYATAFPEVVVYTYRNTLSDRFVLVRP